MYNKVRTKFRNGAEASDRSRPGGPTPATQGYALSAVISFVFLLGCRNFIAGLVHVDRPWHPLGQFPALVSGSVQITIE